MRLHSGPNISRRGRQKYHQEQQPWPRGAQSRSRCGKVGHPPHCLDFESTRPSSLIEGMRLNHLGLSTLLPEGGVEPMLLTTVPVWVRRLTSSPRLTDVCRIKCFVYWHICQFCGKNTFASLIGACVPPCLPVAMKKYLETLFSSGSYTPSCLQAHFYCHGRHQDVCTRYAHYS